MLRLIAIFLLFSTAGYAAPQQPVTVAPLPSDVQSENVAVYFNAPDVAAPEPIPFNFSSPSAHLCKNVEGTPMLAAVVDVHGIPSRVVVLRTADLALDNAAMAYVAAERFKPGTHFNVPVPVAIEVELEFKACEQTAAGPDGKQTVQAVLRAQPKQTLEVLPRPQIAPGMAHPQDFPRSPVERVGGGVTAPVVVNHVEARFTDAARKARIQGTCLIQAIVNAEGNTESPRVIKSIDPGLDQNAVEAVMQYHFKPAMKEGHPVPVMITVEVTFHLYK